MQIAVICEYNPFHLGHAYQIAQIRARFGEDACITAVLGGLFSQRGEPYIAPPYVRAQAAVCCGADLVLELPYPWSAAPAAYFARAGVEIVSAVGADALAFGSECGDLDELLAARRNLDHPQLRAEADALLRSEGGATLGHIRAFERAYIKRYGESPLLKRPNDILALEYLAAIDKLGARITPLAIKRRGSYALDGGDGYASAQKLRMRYAKEGLASLLQDLPKQAFSVFERAADGGLFGADFARLTSALLIALQNTSEAVAFSGGGLLGRLKNAAYSARTLEALFEAAASKRYTDAQIRRCALYALLRTKASAFEEPVRCTRVLAATPRGCGVLAARRKNDALCFLTKPAAYQRMPAAAAAQFASRFAAEYAYALTLPGAYDFLRQSPYISDMEEA